MSLHLNPIGPVPEETAHVAHAAFPNGNRYMQMRDILGSVYADDQFTDVFSGRGRPATSPWRLALVTVMQFAEGLTDRQAAEAVRARIDWKYTLALDLADPGFDYSVLSEFRARLIQGSADQRLLDTLLERCKERGYLKARGRQRTDSTHVLGVLRVLDRVERVAETVRAALNVLAVEAPDWVRTHVSSDWYERYGQRIEEYRLPKGHEARVAYARQVGADGQWLLDSLTSADSADPAASLRGLPEVVTLRLVWEQQFVRGDDGRLELRDPKAVPSASEIVESPYEPEARFATKRGRHWVGYKVHMTETCDEDLPHLVTHVETTQAPATDVGQLSSIQDALAQRALLPTEHLVDAGYMRARNILLSRQRHGIELVGPVDEEHQWQGRVEQGYVTRRFHLDWERRVAVCPEGHYSIRWDETTGPRGRVMSHVSWDRQDCLPCPSRLRCTHATTGARTLLLPARDEYETLVAGRLYQATEAFKQRYALRAGIEGTISQSVRAFGLRQARYRGLRKTHLQQVASAAALNMGRVISWLNGVPRALTRRSRFARLATA
jgi:transposase